ncbi:MAG: class I SAM-dependent methyltransferase [Thiobacillaceae bacterium]|jgi:cyclopropane fatty-acyl-phospholipid synthase-like methyltransferase|nr:class I SAM-dependent methyltransferase [Thiobacillaceae bacterium]
MIDKPFSESSAENREPILAVLREVFADCRKVLEIGSGTGQHAVYFGAELSHLSWQTADLPQHHAGIQMWREEAALPNVLAPIALDVNRPDWLDGRYDAVFSANTLHIVSWPEVEKLFAGVGTVLQPGGMLAIYGPFNYNGQFTSPSNARFDQWLKGRDPASGVRDFEAVDALAREQNLILQRDIAMPVNNRTLVWRRMQ